MTLPSRPPMPDTPEEARARQPWFRKRALEAFQRYQEAKADLERARGECAILDSIAAGDFVKDPIGLVVGNHREVSLKDWAEVGVS